ncbi:hypothetical protein [Longimicrobium terrae]|uniref:hypothetical protein n=1 Tax=Longimicrobium terrae TaxID=1639882 RepID=UPI001475306E|nr:hypothetical protein [Longimicrobium terrae]NNC32357.1 hypothetical protein [Longimicrobium terrae]
MDIIAPDTLVIAEEFGDWDTSQRRIDLLAIDRQANLVVIELKRDETGAHMELQALRYAAMVARITFDQALSAYEKMLARLSRDVDARASLLEFLEWESADETAFAQDVRIVLVAAGFSREITSTVMWLNERDLDIRCVQLQPHWHADELLLDVKQVIPLPQAHQYQVQVAEKAKRERATRSATRDLTRYDVSLYGVTYPALRKRRAILRAVQSLTGNGVQIDDIAQALKHSLPFARYRGNLSRNDLLGSMLGDSIDGLPMNPKYFMTADQDLTRVGDETIAVSKRWGRNTVPELRRLQEAFPEAHLTFSASAEQGPAGGVYDPDELD